MARLLTALVALSVVVLAAGLMRATVHTRTPEPVYSFATVRAQLARDPAAWMGRSILVQAMAVAYHQRFDRGTALTEIDLTDAGAQWSKQYLPVLRGTPDPVVALLRRLPLLGHVLPAPQPLRWGVPAIYRLHFREVPCSAGAPQLCYIALLLDPAP